MSPSEEVKSAVGEADSLEQRAARLRQTIAAPSERELAEKELAEIEAKIAGRREAEGKRAAEARAIAIKRAYGGLLAAAEQLVAKVQAKQNERNAAIGQLNEMLGKINTVRAELAGLVDRFAVPPANLPNTRPELAVDLSVTPHISEREYVQPATELCEFQLRSRRTYAELPADTEAAKIIAKAGLKPFPPLTERQARIVADRKEAEPKVKKAVEREKEMLAEETKRALAEAAETSAFKFGGPKS